MDVKQEVYADGIGEITLSGGMVRIDLVTLMGSQRNSEDKPRLEPRQRIIMPPEGFLRSFSAMEDLVKQLVKAGLIKKRDDNSEGDGQTVTSSAVDTSPPPKSPNF